MATFPLPQRVYALGETASPAIALSQPINGASVDMDCSLWVLAATVDVVVEVSYDSGVSWQHVISNFHDGPPPWNGSTHIVFSVSYGDNPETGLPVTISPTHVRVRGVVAGNALTLGPGVLTVS